jgi:hypothetical protein
LRHQPRHCAICPDCAISLAERRNKAIAPYEPNPTTTIEAQFASFNFANSLICAVRSSVRRAVPAPVETHPLPNALRPHGSDRQLDMPAVGKLEGARNNMPGTALDDESGAVREPAGETIGSAHHNLLKNVSPAQRATRWKFPTPEAVPAPRGPRYRFL